MNFVRKRHNFSALFLGIGSAIILFAFTSCQAPRNNPLDPLNPDFNFGSVEGIVQAVSLPFNAIPDVLISWEGSNLITKTNGEGRFRLDNIPLVDGKLIFSKQGYKSDTLQIVWGTAKRFFSQMFLNEIPVLDEISLYTVVINRFSPQLPSHELFVKTSITDNDRDIDTIYLYSPELSLKKALSYIPDRVYERKLTISELNLSDIEQTIGLDFFIIAKDIFNNEFNIGSGKVARVIKNEISFLGPADGDTVNVQPFSLNWVRFNAGFPFSLTVEIFTDELGNEELKFRKENIHQDSTSCLVEQQLELRNYYWVIWIIDQYGNRSRSKPATFRIR